MAAGRTVRPPPPFGWTLTELPWRRLRYSAEPDTVVFPLVHGPMGEDGTIQGLLEVADVPYVGSGVLASAVCMDKSMAKLVCARHGLPQCRYRTASADDPPEAVAEQAIDDLGLPLFVKPANMGSSVGVSRTTTEFETVKALEAAAQYDQTLIIEEAVTGHEIEVSVLGNREPKASVPGEIVPGAQFYDYADKYLTDGAKLLVPAQIPEAAPMRPSALRWSPTAPCGARAWPGSTSSTSPTAGGCCSARSTPFPASPPSACTPSCGRHRASPTRSSSPLWSTWPSSATSAASSTAAPTANTMALHPGNQPLKA